MSGTIAEEEIGMLFLDYLNSKQKQGFRNYIIKDVVLNTKLTIGGKQISENDINVILERKSWVVNSFKKFFYLRDSENFAIQSKAHKRKIGFEYASHDVINLLMTKVISYNLEARTIVIKESGKSLLEEMLKTKGIPIITEDKLKTHYNVIKIGQNKINIKKYANNSWKHKSIKLGELTILDKGKSRKKLKLVNLIRVDEIDKENYENIKNILDAEIKYLNHNRYAYITPEGVEPKGKEFIERMNGKVINLKTLEEILNKGKLLKSFKKINYYPFGIGREVLGRTESIIYNVIIKNGDFNYEKITKAITKFLTKHHHFRY